MFVPVLMFATAAGIAVFWLDWTRKEHTDTWLPDGYVEHERAFMWSDAVACVLLVTSSSLTIAGFELGERIGLVTAGMLWFLAVLDTAYFAQNGLFAKSRGGFGNGLTVCALFAVAGIIFVEYGL